MKKNFLPTILLALLIACNTDPTSSVENESAIPVTVENLTGQWRWTQSADSLNRIVDGPTASNTRTISITQDCTINEYRNDTLIFNDKFSLGKGMTGYSPDSLSFIDFATSRRFNYLIFSLTSKTLVIGIGLSNKYKDTYSRIN